VDVEVSEVLLIHHVTLKFNLLLTPQSLPAIPSILQSVQSIAGGIVIEVTAGVL
jgi:hypothetical protein